MTDLKLCQHTKMKLLRVKNFRVHAARPTDMPI